jgi:hypothetical protein
MKLREWQKLVLPSLRQIKEFSEPKAGDVTIVAYFYYDDARIDTEFFAIECSILCAYLSCGKLPTILVVNRRTAQIDEFAEKYGITIQLEKRLTGGLKAMNIDCDSRLYERFDTRYVLNVESDGIIVNPGIERFVGKWDYIGAPWRFSRASWYLRPFPDYFVGNSGLCLRSRDICEAAAKLYARYFFLMPYNWCLIEDMFYCKVLRWLSPSFRKKFVFASIEVAAQFSIEWASEYLESVPPLGFHGVAGFQNYVSRYGVPLNNLLAVRSKNESVIDNRNSDL